MDMPASVKRLMAATAAALLVCGGPLAAQSKKPRQARQRPAVAVPSSFQFYGWLSAAPPKKLSGHSLESYLEGASALPFQYGVKDVSVHRFKPATRSGRLAGKELILELFRMGSPDDAFGLFSTARGATELASEALTVPNVVGPERAAVIKGYVYVNIRAKACDPAEMEKIAAAAARRIGLPPTPLPAGIDRLPKAGLISGSERFIRGDIAAGAESPLLNRDFWGFRRGETRAFAARYGPADSKLVVLEFADPQDGLQENVLGLFKEYLEDVRLSDGFVIAADITGATCLFGMAGKAAGLIIGEPDPSAARERLSQALAYAVAED